MPKLSQVFISHSHRDAALASAFKITLRALFAGVEVSFSSDKDAGGGPQAGDNWLQWIQQQMRDCQEALLLLTPYSVQQPWPMWEAGAVGGMAIAGVTAAKTKSQKRVTPIRFNLPPDNRPGPFVVTQSFEGNSEAGLEKLLKDLMKRYNYESHTETVIDGLAKDHAEKFMSSVRAWLTDAPSIVTEGTVAEWCARLDGLALKNRSADAAHLERWIRLMYEGREPAVLGGAAALRAKPVYWDIRIHLRLAQNYAIAGQFDRAIRQYELAKDLAPLDVFVLHQLAKCYLDDKQPESARNIIDRILALDQDALRWNPEVAGLEGRYWKEEAKRAEKEKRPEETRENYTRARDAYRTALTNTEPSFYMADNVGQLSLKIGDLDGARKAYELADRVLKDLTPENENVWSLATRATTAIMLGRDPLPFLGQISTIVPAPSEVDLTSIRGGLKLLQDALGKEAAVFRLWAAALDGSVPSA